MSTAATVDQTARPEQQETEGLRLFSAPAQPTSIRHVAYETGALLGQLDMQLQVAAITRSPAVRKLATETEQDLKLLASDLTEKWLIQRQLIRLVDDAESRYRATLDAEWFAFRWLDIAECGDLLSGDLLSGDVTDRRCQLSHQGEEMLADFVRPLVCHSNALCAAVFERLPSELRVWASLGSSVAGLIYSDRPFLWLQCRASPLPSGRSWNSECGSIAFCYEHDMPTLPFQRRLDKIADYELRLVSANLQRVECAGDLRTVLTACSSDPYRLANGIKEMLLPLWANEEEAEVRTGQSELASSTPGATIDGGECASPSAHHSQQPDTSSDEESHLGLRFTEHPPTVSRRGYEPIKLTEQVEFNLLRALARVGDGGICLTILKRKWRSLGCGRADEIEENTLRQYPSLDVEIPKRERVLRLVDAAAQAHLDSDNSS